MPIIKYKSSDGETFDKNVEGQEGVEDIARCSMTIKTLLEDLGLEEGEEEVIPLPHVDSVILRKIIDWAKHHKDDRPPAEDDESREERVDDISSWDKDFMGQVDPGTLFKLMLAANYLDIKGLLDVACKTFANLVRGKTPEEIRKLLNIKNDYTPEEEEMVRKENEWCEEK